MRADEQLAEKARAVERVRGYLGDIVGYRQARDLARVQHDTRRGVVDPLAQKPRHGVETRVIGVDGDRLERGGLPAMMGTVRDERLGSDRLDRRRNAQPLERRVQKSVHANGLDGVSQTNRAKLLAAGKRRTADLDHAVGNRDCLKRQVVEERLGIDEGRGWQNLVLHDILCEHLLEVQSVVCPAVQSAGLVEEQGLAARVDSERGVISRADKARVIDERIGELADGGRDAQLLERRVGKRIDADADNALSELDALQRLRLEKRMLPNDRDAVRHFEFR